MASRRRGRASRVRLDAETRFRRARLIVGGLFVVLLLAWINGWMCRPSVLGEAALAAAEYSTGVAVEAVAHSTPNEPALPPGFADEVAQTAGWDEVRVDERGRIVGFCVFGTADAAFARLADGLVGNGWSRIESGSATCGSFSKSDGIYRWIFVSCVQVGDSTSVVVQYATADEGR